MEKLPRRAALEQLLATSVPVRAELDERCRELLERLRERCPEALQRDPVPPGEIRDPVVLDDGQASELFIAALADERGTEALLLSDGANELLVRLGECRLIAREGLLLASLIVESEQTGAVEVTIPFAVGSDQTLSGMVMATEDTPRGPTAIVTIWGEALQALAWEALLTLTAGLTRHTGTDVEAGPLIPGALLAARGEMRIVPQARHLIDLDRKRGPRR